MLGKLEGVIEAGIHEIMPTRFRIRERHDHVARTIQSGGLRGTQGNGYEFIMPMRERAFLACTSNQSVSHAETSGEDEFGVHEWLSQ
ncbi:hypothetical protein GWA01_19090 [Gluconobacter wancherniae NBRC 103581]|uniref:Uncharacterized protein n=1 Tax=Gluconobacter wancherniae NBRC 103581 TaxID=656744 RepID=A0A511B100_9PROT|nr:hypothetical protein GWA01_19090 [Gluconobacter wancherniae NBRC 103581]